MLRVCACLVLVLLHAGPLAAQLPAAQVEAQRAKLLEGVSRVPKSGAPGPVAVWGRLAFPVLAAAGRSREAAEQAVMAAAGHGKGRIVLFGHNAYVDGRAEGDAQRLRLNAVRWAGQRSPLRIGLLGLRAAESLQQPGWELQPLRDASPEELRRVDVLVANAQALTDAEQGRRIVAWVEAGGGLVAGMTGWAFAQTSGGQDLVLAHGLNRALTAAGLAFTDQSGFDGVADFAARPQLAETLNASAAMSRLLAAKNVPLTPDASTQAAASVQLALAVQPPDASPFRDAVLAALARLGGEAGVPTRAKPWTQAEQAAARLRLGLETRLLRLPQAGAVAAHPAHAVFPGAAPASAPRVTQAVPVNPSVPGWTSTGLYAAAGEALVVRLPAERVKEGYALRIGCHTDTLYSLDAWARAPEISKRVPLTGAETRVASAFGGLVYLEVPERGAAAAPFAVTVQGGIAAPLFVLGRDDDDAWNREIKLRPAPWAELACDRMILSVPSEVARSVQNPTQLMEFWKRVVEAQDDIANQTAERRRPERMVADVQISAGFMHSGYPIMLHLPEAVEMVTYGRIRFPGWGFHHEIGHNHQRREFTFDGAGEVTNNVLGMYVYHAVLQKDWLIGHTGIAEEARRRHVAAIRAAPDKWAAWKANPFLALTTYIELVQAFGWESWRAYLHSFADPAFGPKPADDAAARDQFLVRYSRITRRNLGPFFEFWGIPVSAQARSAVAELPVWLPEGR